jgi:hypothetical protein
MAESSFSVRLTMRSTKLNFFSKNIEKDTLKKDRSQFYEANLVLFHNPGILAKNFLTQMIDPANDHRSCYSQLRIRPQGSIRAFSVRAFHVCELTKSADLLCIRFILLFPRFEQNISESIRPCEI